MDIKENKFFQKIVLMGIFVFNEKLNVYKKTQNFIRRFIRNRVERK